MIKLNKTKVRAKKCIDNNYITSLCANNKYKYCSITGEITIVLIQMQYFILTISNTLSLDALFENVLVLERMIPAHLSRIDYLESAEIINK